jgi:hypothetical protein
MMHMAIAPINQTSDPNRKITSTERLTMDSKSLLARLMATENIAVEHDPFAQTAYFEPKNRRLVLPCWKDITNDMYDMLVAHEVSHAIFTPPGDAYEAAAKMIDPNGSERAASYLNVIEDARIEKLIKRRYPGVITNFRVAYKQLHDQNFFGLQDATKQTDLPLIDKINLRAKLGTHADAVVVMNPIEEMWYYEVMGTETWDQVVDLTKRLYDSLKLPELPPPVQVPGGAGHAPDDVMNGSESLASGAVPDSLTEGCTRTNAASMVDPNAPQLVYLEYPANIDVTKLTVDYSVILRRLANLPTVPGILSEFTKNSEKWTSSMAKTFHVRQAADAHERTMIHRSGVLDIRKIVHYQTQEDLFKRNATVRAGKNHGIVVYLDWSGSMDSCMGSTLRQLAMLVLFAKKIGVPFEVYAFSDAVAVQGSDITPISSGSKSTSIDFTKIALLNLLSHRMKASEFTTMMERLLVMAKMYDRTLPGYSSANIPPSMELCGTPLNRCLVTARYVNRRFIEQTGVQILNTIVLTDGADTAGISTENGKYSWNGHKIFRDAETKAQTLLYENENQTAAICSMLRSSTATNLVGMFLAPSDCKHTIASLSGLERGTPELNRLLSTFRQQRFVEIQSSGYDSFFVIPSQELEDKMNTRDDEMEKTLTKGRIAGAFIKSRAVARSKQIVLDRVVDLISAKNIEDRSRVAEARRRQDNRK